MISWVGIDRYLLQCWTVAENVLGASLVEDKEISFRNLLEIEIRWNSS